MEHRERTFVNTSAQVIGIVQIDDVPVVLRLPHAQTWWRVSMSGGYMQPASGGLIALLRYCSKHLLTLLLLWSAGFGLEMANSSAEVSQVTVAKGYGLGYLPLLVMEHEKLLEKHAKSNGLGNIEVNWRVFSGPALMNDALLSGTANFVPGGIPAFATLWSKTKGKLDVRGVAALSAMPEYLNTRNPNIKTIKDFTDHDKIALPSVKVSGQAIFLEMAAARIFGENNYAKLDPLTVSLSHPDGMTALLSGKSAVDSHFTAPPFQYWELQKPGIHRVLSSFDILGGPHSFVIVYAIRAFRDKNPKTYAAFMAALNDSISLIEHDKQKAAKIYLELSHDKRDSIQDVLKILNNPEITYTMTPENIMKVVQFMHKVGSIKTQPASWKDLFFPEIYDLPGS